MNSYAYARNNPIVFTDPTGELTAISNLGTILSASLNTAKAVASGVSSLISAFSSPKATFNSALNSTKSAVNYFVNTPNSVIALSAGSSIMSGASSIVNSYKDYINSTTFADGWKVGQGPVGTIGSTIVTFGGMTVTGLSRGSMIAGSEVSTTKEVAQVLVNQSVGNAFRDKVAEFMTTQGRTTQTEVMKNTPFGRRFIDVEVSDSLGNVLGGIETKTGGSRYLPTQRAKDMYLKLFHKYTVNVVRDQE